MVDYCYCGWPVTSTGDGIDRGFTIAGVQFPGGVRAGDPATAFRYLLTEFNARVEPLVVGWCWGYTYKENANSPGQYSCHAGGVAVDVNAPDHGNGGSQYEGFTSDQVAAIRQIMAELPAFQWGADYAGTKDAMHFELHPDVSAAELAGLVAGLPSNGDDDVTDDDIDKIADRVIDRLESKVFRSNFVAKDAAGKPTVEDPNDANLFDTIASANTNTTRIYLGKSQA